MRKGCSHDFTAIVWTGAYRFMSERRGQPSILLNAINRRSWKLPEDECEAVSDRTRKTARNITPNSFDDFVATGMLALWEAMLAYRLDSPASLETHVRPRIAGAISDEAKAYYKRGITGETRVDGLLTLIPATVRSGLLR